MTVRDVRRAVVVLSSLIAACAVPEDDAAEQAGAFSDGDTSDGFVERVELLNVKTDEDCIEGRHWQVKYPVKHSGEKKINKFLADPLWGAKEGCDKWWQFRWASQLSGFEMPGPTALNEGGFLTVTRSFTWSRSDNNGGGGQSGGFRFVSFDLTTGAGPLEPRNLFDVSGRRLIEAHCRRSLRTTCKGCGVPQGDLDWCRKTAEDGRARLTKKGLYVPVNDHDPAQALVVEALSEDEVTKAFELKEVQAGYGSFLIPWKLLAPHLSDTPLGQRLARLAATAER